MVCPPNSLYKSFIINLKFNNIFSSPSLIESLSTLCMEGENFPYLFAPSLPLASLNLPPLLDQPMNNSQYASDFDLANMLSSSMVNGDQNPVFPCLSTMSRDKNEGENVNKNKAKSGRKKKYIPPRVAFHTRSAEDILDDGYKWRKYGQKAVKNSAHPRSYYRCTHHTCNVKKQVQRLAKDTSIVVTTYEGIHNHPCEKLMETLIPLVKQLQFLSKFPNLPSC